MAVYGPPYRITPHNSIFEKGATAESQSIPGWYIVERDAFIWQEHLRGQWGNFSALELLNTGWKVSIQGTVSSGPSSSLVHSVGVLLATTSEDKSKLYIGEDGLIVGGTAAIEAFHPTDIDNNGTIAGAIGISQHGNGNWQLINSKTGTIDGAFWGIKITGAGVHAIINAGQISGDNDQFGIQGAHGSEKITNSGVINYGVHLGGGNDVFRNSGTVTGIIILGDGDDKFFGGSLSETVLDGQGHDIIRFGGGDDRYLADVSMREDDVDVINGGSGLDTYSVEYTQLLLINLDKVTHIDPISSAEVSGNTAIVDGLQKEMITNFENATVRNGASSISVVFGNSSANVLIGGYGDDHIFGFGGNDTLVGGGGNDHLYGGSGKDHIFGSGSATVHYEKLSDSGPSELNRDVVYQFRLIDLSAIDANSKTKSDDAFNFVGGTDPRNGIAVAFSGTPGELRFTVASGQTIVFGDVNGDAVADFSIAIEGRSGVFAGDFIL